MKTRKVVPQERDPRLKGLSQFKDLPPERRLEDRVKRALANRRGSLDAKLPDPPVVCVDIPQEVPPITQLEIVAYATSHHHFQLARADFEAKRAGLVLKLFALCKCEDGNYFALLDEHGNLVLEDRASLDAITGRPILECNIVPSGGAA